MSRILMNHNIYPLTVVQQQLLVCDIYIFIAIVTITDIQQQYIYTDTGHGTRR